MNYQARLKKCANEMPKIELHAHLNGSISQSTLKKLINRKPEEIRQKFEAFDVRIDHGHCRTLSECFEMFKLVHQIVNDPDSIYQAVCNVIQEFAADGVVYLELRSTPRQNLNTGLTQRTYMEAVLKGIKDSTSDPIELQHYDKSQKPIIVRYLPSIDRRNSVEYAAETLALAFEFKEKCGLVVGIDLSGDGTINDARDFYPILIEAKKNGLKLALHLAEVEHKTDETCDMLDLPPDRIGHGTHIHPNFGGTNTLLEKTRDRKIPLELCLTSNVKGQVTPSYDAHHFRTWYSMKHPICVCTDDKGVFACNLSEEFACVAETFQLSVEDMLQLSEQAIEYIFEGTEVKNRIHEYLSSWKTLACDATSTS